MLAAGPSAAGQQQHISGTFLERAARCLPSLPWRRTFAGCGVIVHHSDKLGLVLVDRNTGGSTWQGASD